MKPAILQLEDDENDVMFFKFAFKGAHIANPVFTVRDGQEAIDYLSGAGRYADRRHFPLPVIVFLDLKTPRRTGQDVLKWIRAQPKLRRMVVVILSASGNQHDVNAAYDAGANAFLVKPAGLDKLTEMMRAVQLFWLVHNQFSAEIGNDA